MRKKTKASGSGGKSEVDALVSDVTEIIDAARRTAVRSTNAMMTAAYWSVGRRIVEEEQRGSRRAEYGETLIHELAITLTRRLGRGYAARNLAQMKAFYLAYPVILQTLSARSHRSTKSFHKENHGSVLAMAASAFRLPWSHYVHLLRVASDAGRAFYENEALRGGWTVRQLSRQISTQFFERTIRAKDREEMLRKGQRSQPDNHLTVAESIRDPYVLEFLDLKDEYSESEAEEALINRMQAFLLELGDDFAFVGRQKRLRVDDTWMRVDLVFFHRRLRCLVIVDLKRGELSAADAGQINLYCNYAREHWMREGENPPVGLVLCTAKRAGLARYAFEGLGSQVLVAEYRTVLPSETELAMEMARAQVEIERRQLPSGERPLKTPKPPRGGRVSEAFVAWMD